MTGNDKIEQASLTDVGLRRSHNQDAYAVLLASDDEHWRSQGHIFVVSDGMGAHAVGELASELAAKLIPHTYHKYAEEGGEDALRKAFVEANASIHNRGQQNREFKGMGTTSTALLLRPEGAWIGHVGDSRAYRIREGRIEQLSFDHSLLWEMARRNKVSPSALLGVPSNVIVRSLGPEPHVQVDVEGPHPLRKGDTFLLCSDGLSGPVTDQEIGLVASILPPTEACHFLIDLANLRGGPDNITVVIVRVFVDTDPALIPAEQEQEKHRAWYLSVYWAYAAMLVGIGLGVQAVFLAIDKQPGGVVYFALAVLALLAGLAGLGGHFLWDRSHAGQSSPRQKLKIHAQASCQVQHKLLEKLSKSSTDVEQQIREKQWEVDWDTYQKHRNQAEAKLLEDDLPAAFHEHCRAMRILTDVLRKHRQKEEAFHPNWDKAK